MGPYWSFPLHIKQISTLPPLHMLVKTGSQVTIPSRTLAIVPATFDSIPKPNFYYNLIRNVSPIQVTAKYLCCACSKNFGIKLPVHLLCTIIKTSPDYVILPKIDILVK